MTRMSLTYIPCTPYKDKVFDVSQGKTIEQTFDKVAVRIWEQPERPVEQAQEIGPNLWAYILPCPKL